MKCLYVLVKRCQRLNTSATWTAASYQVQIPQKHGPEQQDTFWSHPCHWSQCILRQNSSPKTEALCSPYMWAWIQELTSSHCFQKTQKGISLELIEMLDTNSGASWEIIWGLTYHHFLTLIAFRTHREETFSTLVDGRQEDFVSWVLTTCCTNQICTYIIQKPQSNERLSSFLLKMARCVEFIYNLFNLEISLFSWQCESYWVVATCSAFARFLFNESSSS